MIYEIIKNTDSLLHQTLEDFDFSNPPVDPIEFAHELTQSMLHHGGIGLAANQIGFSYRVFAIAANPVLVCYNPKIIDTSDGDIVLEEGCLSFPNLFVKVKRPKNIRVRYTQPNGEVVTERFDGMTARIFQHEFSHLEGLTMLDQANRIHREQAFNSRDRKMRKIKREIKTN